LLALLSFKLQSFLYLSFFIDHVKESILRLSSLVSFMLSFLLLSVI
jgi:hypothetical protein